MIRRRRRRCREKTYKSWTTEAPHICRVPTQVCKCHPHYTTLENTRVKRLACYFPPRLPYPPHRGRRARRRSTLLINSDSSGLIRCNLPHSHSRFSNPILKQYPTFSRNKIRRAVGDLIPQGTRRGVLEDTDFSDDSMFGPEDLLA